MGRELDFRCPNSEASRNSSCELWFRRTKCVAPQMRLLCFPYAGGSARIYRNWPDWFAPEVEGVAVGLPGRCFHMRSPLVDNLDTLMAQLLTVIGPVADLPFAVFGHSMGALIAFELCRVLRRTGRRTPVHLFASGMCAPHMLHLKKPAH